MKNTNAKMEALIPFSIEKGWRPMSDDKINIKLSFELVYEDWQIMQENLTYMNQQTNRDDDLSDHMMTMITYAIHQLYEARTGEKFVLRMERQKN